MRVLIVDNDSEMLESVARRLHDGFSIDAVTSKADALDLLRQNDLHVVVACEQLSDGTGLDLLSQTAKRWPGTLRLFAASADRIALLRGRLGPFKLFQTLHYPIDPGELGSILMLAQAAQAADADTANVQHIVLGDDRAGQTETPASVLARASMSAAPSLAVARGAARPLPFTVASPTPARAPAAPAGAPPAQRKPVTRESLAALHRPTPPRAMPTAPPPMRRAPADRPMPRATDVLPALAQLRSRLHGTAGGHRPRRKRLVLAAAVLGVLAAGALAVWLGAGDPGETPTAQASSAEADAAIEPVILEIEAALTVDNMPRARRALQRLRRIAPQHERLTFFETLVNRRVALGRAVAAASEPQPAAAPEAVDPEPAELGTSQTPGTSDLPGTAAPETEVAPEATPAQTFSGRTLESSGSGSAPIGDPSDLPPAVREAKLVKRATPEYPPGAAANGTEGTVEIAFTVTAAGRVTDAVVLEANPAGVFDHAALSAVRHWRYEPRIEDGVPVDWQTRARIEFKLAQ